MPRWKDISREERFWEKVDRSPDECWNWTGAKKASGYGVFRADGPRNVVAHRFAYELVIGPIPAGLELDHLCRNRACVNPAHLEPVTRLENILRGVGPDAQRARFAAQTHCKHGHEFTEANTYRHGGLRHCRACRAERARRARRTA